MNEVKDLELEIVDLGDATEVTKGYSSQPLFESNLDPALRTKPIEG
jgi:hypothetical protein